jgi:hypothetical protein
MDETHREQMARAAAALLPRSNSIADAITDELLATEEASYGSAGDAVRADLRASIRAHIRYGILMLSDHTEVRGGAVDLWRETGQRRAQQGVPIAVVLHAYTLGTRLLWDALVESGQTLGVAPEVLLSTGQTLWSDLDTQCQIVRERYRREELVLHGQDAARVEEVLSSLLQGRGSDPEFAAEARRVLRLDADSELLCLVWLPRQPLTSASLASERLLNAGHASHWWMHGEHAVGIASGSADNWSRLRAVMARSVRGRVGTATCREGLTGVVAAYHHALTAATNLPPSSDGVADIVEQLPEAIVAGSPELASLLVEETIAPLLHLAGATRQALLETLGAAVRHGGSASGAAEDLVCHRNTVLYRMKRIEGLTGYSFEAPRDRLMLTLAWLAIRGGEALEPERSTP